ncbi:hypothetical protein [Stieleria neptunia]|uniref:hypothetical protein n=1 Tax=Stieleria neptunia TaxID=2527979 RepID=UPI001E30C8CD|nr:hypothetical protein [Stieleria neptunia]
MKPAASESTIVSCPSCQTKMSVKLLAKPAVTACPQCKTQVRLPAKSPTAPSRVQAPAKRNASAERGTGPPAQSPTALPNESPAFSALPPTPGGSDPFDLGQLDLPQPAAPSGADFTARSRGTKSSSNTGAFPARLWAWVGDHKIVTAILALNVVALLSSIFFPPLLLVCAVQLPVGLLIAGATFLPRLHLVERVSKAVGAQMAGIGAGGVMLLILVGLAKGGLRIARRSSRNENLDFSGFDPSSLGAMAGALVVFLCVSALIIYCWKLIGIVRVIAAGYLLEMSILLVLLIIGGAVNSRREAEMARYHKETMSKMQRPEWATPGIGSPGSRPPGSRPPGSRPPGSGINARQPPNAGGPNASEIRIIVMHGPNTDLAEVRESFLAKAGHPDHETQSKGMMMTEWVIQDSGSPGELAELVDFGRVLHVSEFTRTIRVGMPRVRP